LSVTLPYILKTRWNGMMPLMYGVSMELEVLPGTILLGVFASTAINPVGADGLLTAARRFLLKKLWLLQLLQSMHLCLPMLC